MNPEDYPEYLDLLDSLEDQLYLTPQIQKAFTKDQQNIIEALENDEDPQTIIEKYGLEFIETLLLLQFVLGFIGPLILLWHGRKYRKKPMENPSPEVIAAVSERYLRGRWDAMEQSYARKIEAFSEKRPTLKRGLASAVKESDRLYTRRFIRTSTTAYGNYLLLENIMKMYPGHIIKKGWLSMRDSRVRPTHIEADKKYNASHQLIYAQELFYVGGEFMLYPGAGIRPENNINCRCSLSFQII